MKDPNDLRSLIVMDVIYLIYKITHVYQNTLWTYSIKKKWLVSLMSRMVSQYVYHEQAYNEPLTESLDDMSKIVASTT